MEVKFQEEAYTKRTLSQQSKGITGWLMSNGVVKNESQAFVIYIALCVVCWIAIFILLFSGNDASTDPIDPNAPDPAAIDPETGLPYSTG